MPRRRTAQKPDSAAPKPHPTPSKRGLRGIATSQNGKVSKRSSRRGPKQRVKEEKKEISPSKCSSPTSLPTIHEGDEGKANGIDKDVKKKVKIETKVEKGLRGLKFVGAHVSASGTIDSAITNAVAIGAKSFAFFLRNQRQWASKPLDGVVAEKFRAACKENGFEMHHVLPHGTYLMNLGSPKADILKKSRDAFVDELKRCDVLGIQRYNFHPGSSCGEDKSEAIVRIAESINLAHKETHSVITVLENMSKQGHTLGGEFQELAAIIDLVQDKTRVGVCIDTCHAFAAGFDVATEDGFNAMLQDFDNIIGKDYLMALHLNDSKGPCNSHLDRHECIGRGKIGKGLFKLIMNNSRFDDMPLIIETPYTTDEAYEKEIKLLYSMIDN